MELIDCVYIYHLMAGEKAAWHGRYHSHDERHFEIHFFSEGEGTFLSNSTSWPVQEDLLFLTGPREFHSIVPKEIKKPLTYCALLFYVDESEEELYRILINALKDNKKISVDKKDFMVRFNFDEIVRLQESDSPDMKKAATLLLEGCIYRWYGRKSTSGILRNLNGLEEGTPDSADRNRLGRSHVEHSIKFMEKKVYENCTIEETASACGITPEHYIRIFKEFMHMTPHQYFIRLKIQSAALVLINSRDTIAKVAQNYAFENQFHFSRVFKKCTGLTPSAYRAAFSVL